MWVLQLRAWTDICRWEANITGQSSQKLNAKQLLNLPHRRKWKWTSHFIKCPHSQTGYKDRRHISTFSHGTKIKLKYPGYGGPHLASDIIRSQNSSCSDFGVEPRYRSPAYKCTQPITSTSQLSIMTCHCIFIESNTITGKMNSLINISVIRTT